MISKLSNLQKNNIQHWFIASLFCTYKRILWRHNEKLTAYKKYRKPLTLKCVQAELWSLTTKVSNCWIFIRRSCIIIKTTIEIHVTVCLLSLFTWRKIFISLQRYIYITILYYTYGEKDSKLELIFMKVSRADKARRVICEAFANKPLIPVLSHWKLTMTSCKSSKFDRFIITKQHYYLFRFFLNA